MPMRRPAAGDGTDFGSAAQGGAPVDHTFTIRNDGGAALTVGGVSVPVGFSLLTSPAASVASGATTTFTVRLSIRQPRQLRRRRFLYNKR